MISKNKDIRIEVFGISKILCTSILQYLYFSCISVFLRIMTHVYALYTCDFGTHKMNVSYARWVCNTHTPDNLYYSIYHIMRRWVKKKAFPPIKTYPILFMVLRNSTIKMHYKFFLVTGITASIILYFHSL